MFTFYRRGILGEYQILERYSTHYIEEHFGVDKDNVSIIKNDMLESGEQTCFDDYKIYYHLWRIMTVSRRKL